MNRNITHQFQEQRGVDIRLPSTAFLGIDSADRYTSNLQQATEPTTPYQMTLVQNQNFLNGFFTRIALTEIKFPWTIPTITERNSKIQFYSFNGATPAAGNPYTITLNPLGWLGMSAIALQLQTKIRATTPDTGFVLTATPIDGIYNARASVGRSFYFLPYEYPGQINRIGLFEMMNWTFPGATIASNSSAAFGSKDSGIATLLSTQYVDIVCASLTQNQSVKDSSTANIPRDVLCRLYLCGDGINPLVPTIQTTTGTSTDGTTTTTSTSTSLSGEIGDAPFTVYRNFNTPKQIKWSPIQPIGSMVLEVYDDAGYLLTTDPDTNIQSTFPDYELLDYNITLLVTEV